MTRFGLAAVVGMVLLAFLLGGGWTFYRSWSACLGGESAALQEFPHYAEPQSGPSPLMGTCQVRYTTRATRTEVLGYYGERLRKNGWEILGFPESADGGLAARRDGYNYRVSYERPSKENPDPQIPDGKALVICSVTEEGR